MYGDLKKVLNTCSDKGVTLSCAEQLHFCQQMASGLAFIATKRIVHLDIAARNCLVHSQSRLKIADFGLSRRYNKPAGFVMTGRMKIPFLWCPPECLPRKLWDKSVRGFNPVFNEDSDIWAYGVVVWEIATYGGQPYGKGQKLVATLKKIDNGLRLQMPAGTPHAIQRLSSRCLALEPGHRPRFATLDAELAAQVAPFTPDLRDIGATLNASLAGRMQESARRISEIKSRNLARVLGGTLKAISKFKKGLSANRGSGKGRAAEQPTGSGGGGDGQQSCPGGCGARLPLSKKFCGGCGFKIKRAVASPPPSPTPAAKTVAISAMATDATWACAACSYEHSTKAETGFLACRMCATPKAATAPSTAVVLRRRAHAGSLRARGGGGGDGGGGDSGGGGGGGGRGARPARPARPRPPRPARPDMRRLSVNLSDPSALGMVEMDFSKIVGNAESWTASSERDHVRARRRSLDQSPDAAGGGVVGGDEPGDQSERSDVAVPAAASGGDTQGEAERMPGVEAGGGTDGSPDQPVHRRLRRRSLAERMISLSDVMSLPHHSDDEEGSSHADLVGGRRGSGGSGDGTAVREMASSAVAGNNAGLGEAAVRHDGQLVGLCGWPSARQANCFCSTRPVPGGLHCARHSCHNGSCFVGISSGEQFCAAHAAGSSAA
jgi:uncharacterized membrane protein YgcG